MNDKGNGDCECRNCKGVYRISYSPGSCEAVVKCEACRRLYYSLLFERMSLSGGDDDLEEYQIPITEEEFILIKQNSEKELDLGFLKGRKSRVIHSGGFAEVTAEFAFGRCGKTF